MIYDGLAISMVMLLLAGGILTCIAATAMPLFMNRRNAGDLMPIALKGAKISAILAAICIVVELASPGSVVRAPGLELTTAVLFLWSLGLFFLLKQYGRRLHFGNQ